MEPLKQGTPFQDTDDRVRRIEDNLSSCPLVSGFVLQTTLSTTAQKVAVPRQFKRVTGSVTLLQSAAGTVLLEPSAQGVFSVKASAPMSVKLWVLAE